MQEDDSVSILEEVLSRCGSPSSSREIIDKPDSLILQGYSGASGSNESHTTSLDRVPLDEHSDNLSILSQILWGRVVCKIFILCYLDCGGSFQGSIFHREQGLMSS